MGVALRAFWKSASGQLVVALAIIIAMIDIVWLHSPPLDYREVPRNQPNAVGTQKETQADKAGPKEPSLVFPLNGAKHAQSETNSANTKRQQSSDEWSISDKIAAVIGVVALLQFFALIATWWLMARTARRQLRAYVYLDSGSVFFTQAWDCINASAMFRNAGQTPGHHVRTWANIRVGDISDQPFLEAPPVTVADPRSIIGPQSLTHILRAMLVTPDQIEDIRAGRKAIFFWGCVDYVDVFKARRYFIFNCRMTGQDAILLDRGINKTYRGWELMPHPAGYKAN